jgi:hypothetical protein
MIEANLNPAARTAIASPEDLQPSARRFGADKTFEAFSQATLTPGA